MPRNRVIFTLIVLAITAVSLGAWEYAETFGVSAAYYTDDHKGGGTSGFQLPSYVPKEADESQAWLDGPYGPSGANFTEDETRQLGSGWGSAEIEFFYRFRATTPFLQGKGALTKDNNLRFEVKPVLSPATFHLETEARFTPIAFLQFHAGVDIGTGWPLGFLGLHGLAVNNSDDLSDTDASGIVTLTHMGGTFQFDLAAVVPGDFNHIVISATAQARYINYNQAGSGEAWYWRADAGQNFNGWDYKGDYALGWQPPWKVNFIGVIAEHRFWISESVRELAPMDATFDPGTPAIDDLPAQENWGSDFHSWRFGPVMNFELKEKHALLLVLQFRNGLYYTEETAYARYFRRWDYSGNKYVKFDRVALAYSYNF